MFLFCVQIKVSTLTQVCIPGLHLSLGIFFQGCLSCWRRSGILLTCSWHIPPPLTTASPLLQSILLPWQNCAEELQSHKQHTEAVEQIITYLSLTLPDAESNPQLAQVQVGAAAGRMQIQEMVRYLLTCTECVNLTHL